MTFHIPVEILGPILVAAIGAGVTSYVWLLRKTIELSEIVKELQKGQKRLSKEIFGGREV